MKKCTHCGMTPLPDHAIFCSRCGSSQLMPASVEIPKKKPGKFLSLAYAYLFVLLFNAVVFAVSFTSGIVLAIVFGFTDVEQHITVDLSNIIMIIAYILLIAVLALIFSAMHKNPLKEAAVNKFPLRLIPLAALFGYSANLIYAFAVELIPWPQTIIDKHIDSYSDIGTYGANLIITILATAVFTGIVEELVFRGLVMTRLRVAYGRVASVVISALIFGFAHPTLISCTYSFVLGLFLGAIFIKYNSVLPCMIVHIFFNLAACIGYPEEPILILGMLFICAAFYLLATYLIFRKGDTGAIIPETSPNPQDLSTAAQESLN